MIRLTWTEKLVNLFRSCSDLFVPIFYGDAVTLPKIFFTVLIVIGVGGLAVISLQ